MKEKIEESAIPDKKMLKAIQEEGKKFQDFYLWLQNGMTSLFFEEISSENLMLITHNLMGLHQQDFFSTINLKGFAIVLCLDSADADLKILKNYEVQGIKSYNTYVSKIPPPFEGVEANLRIAVIYFTGAETDLEVIPSQELEEFKNLIKQKKPDLSNEELAKLISGINTRFLKSQPKNRLGLALDLFFRAKTRDNCQYEVRYDDSWQEKDTPSMYIILAWKNVPKHHFLYRLARVIHRYQLVMKRVHATYVDPYSTESVLLMALSLHGNNGQAVWEVADIPDFLRELVTVKYFASFDPIDQQLVNKGIIPGHIGNFLRASVNFIHQILVHVDSHQYSVENVEEGLCRHPELTVKLCDAFRFKLDPEYHDYPRYLKIREEFIDDVEKLDTGQEEYDLRRKNILLQGINFVDHILKTNLFRHNYTSISFRLDPKYLDHVPFDRSKKFPEIPFAIFFTKGMHFFGFHIRFKDLARGGLRTVYPEQYEHMIIERNNVFSECYYLAWTQQKKNKDIPEGGAKGVIFLKPFDRLESEAFILQKELEDQNFSEKDIEEKILKFRKDQKQEFLYQAQRSFIESLITIVNCDPDGRIRAKWIIDYWKKPEYIYIGPDENMHDSIIQWCAAFSKKYGYRPGSAFITSKPVIGINHKEYGVTSRGVFVYVNQILLHLGINPEKEFFSLKMSGGPDGDVAGNFIHLLYQKYPKTAKLVALTDISGTIQDLQGLDLAELDHLFKEGKAIRYYSPEKLSEGGFLLDRYQKKYQSAFVQQTLCYRKRGGIVIQEWISGSEMNHLFRNNVHQTKADIFVPAGGRPRTLNDLNVQDFLDETGKPTAKAIVEGANLYLTEKARRYLEERGVLVIKDSSANKAGVICSSFEVICGLALSDAEFIENKERIVSEVLSRLEKYALEEANLLLKTRQETGEFLTEISDRISRRINLFKYQILDHLEMSSFENRSDLPLKKPFLEFMIPILREQFQDKLEKKIPDLHKKAIVACQIGSKVVYHKGLGWLPTIVDILPLID